MSDDPDQPHKPQSVYRDIGVVHEALGTAHGNATANAEARALRWMPITAETRVIALVIGALGLCLWWTRFEELGDNLIAATVVVFIVDGIDQLRKFLNRCPWCRGLLEGVGLGQKEVP